MDTPAETSQAAFARRWGHLRRDPVRALAWLLDAPDLLDVRDPHWEGRIATVGPVGPETARWLAALDADPAPLDAVLGTKVQYAPGPVCGKADGAVFRPPGPAGRAQRAGTRRARRHRRRIRFPARCGARWPRTHRVCHQVLSVE